MNDVGSRFLPGGLIYKISFRTQPQNRLPPLQIFICRHLLKLFRRPHIELAFFALTIGVFGRVEGSFRGGHVPQHVAEDIFCCFCKQRLFGNLIGLQVSGSDYGLIVEHFFKMRQKPFGIGGIAVKTKADMIPDAAQAHGI